MLPVRCVGIPLPLLRVEHGDRLEATRSVLQQHQAGLLDERLRVHGKELLPRVQMQPGSEPGGEVVVVTLRGHGSSIDGHGGG